MIKLSSAEFFSKNVKALADAVLQKRIAWLQAQSEEYRQLANSTSFSIEFSSYHPLFDEKAIAKACQIALQFNCSVTIKTNCPGSTADIKHMASNNQMFVISDHFDSFLLQIARDRRQFIFWLLCESLPNISEMTFQQILQYLRSEEWALQYYSYGNSKSLSVQSDCPACGHSGSENLRRASGHPLNGFIPHSKNDYLFCESCQLAFMKYRIDKKQIGVYYQNPFYKTLTSDIDSYFPVTPSNCSHVENYNRIEKYIIDLKPEQNLIDVGAGIGQFVWLARKRNPNTQIYFNDFSVSPEVMSFLKELRIEYVNDLNTTDKEFDLITLWEVLEHIHLDILDAFVKNLKRICKNGGLIILSTPCLMDPICSSIDFWGMAPGEHQFVFTRYFLKTYFGARGLILIDEYRESVTIKNHSWFEFYHKNPTTISNAGEAFIISNLLDDADTKERFRKRISEEQTGSEMILVFKNIKL